MIETVLVWCALCGKAKEMERHRVPYMTIKFATEPLTAWGWLAAHRNFGCYPEEIDRAERAS